MQEAVREAGIRGQVQHRRKLKAKADLKAIREAVQEVAGEALPREYPTRQPSQNQLHENRLKLRKLTG